MNCNKSKKEIRSGIVDKLSKLDFSKDSLILISEYLDTLNKNKIKNNRYVKTK